jgi:hypothetical protein
VDNPLTPVEALQREIDETRAYLGLRVETRPLVNKYLAALELAKADAEMEAHKSTEPKHPDPNFIVGTWTFEVWGPWRDELDRLAIAIAAARTKFYEALKR